MSLCIKFGEDKGVLRNFVFGDLTVKFDCLSRPSAFYFEEDVECICVSWSEDHLGLVSRRLDTIYDKRGL